jgi:phosphate transport system substrate-binding protein
MPPLSRPLYVYAKNAALRRPEVLGFLRYYLDNVADLATRARYVAPTAEDQAANRAALSAAAPAAPATDSK